MKISRRQLAHSLALGTATAASALVAQAPLLAQQAAQSPELAGARASLLANAQAVRSVALPISTEPASQFRAKG